MRSSAIAFALCTAAFALSAGGAAAMQEDEGRFYFRNKP